MYEEEKLGGSICRALAEETCLFPNPMLCKPFEEGMKCRYTANSSQSLVVSFSESIVRGNVAHSVIQQQVYSTNDVCFIKIIKRGGKTGYFHKAGEEKQLMKNEKASSNLRDFNP